MKRLLKSAIFTDIHFGRKSNSPQHNADCLQFIEWFCEEVRHDPTIDHVLFLGDWHEHRSALNIGTLHFSYVCAELLNKLGIPVFFCVGNHDLHHRHTRGIHSVIHFNEFNNFTIIDKPTILTNIGDGALLSPYLFDHEYADTAGHLSIPFWAGHFEFKDFVITGHSIKMQSGPDPKDFSGPECILSGHFHKRQTSGNITYIGNTFPMDFGDVGDLSKGMAIFDHITGKLSFKNWEDCPSYSKIKLSDILEGGVDMRTNARVKCVVDVPITYEEHIELKNMFMTKFSLREFFMEDSNNGSDVLSETEITCDLTEVTTIDDMVVKLLSEIKSDTINSSKLVDIYKGLSTQ